MRVSEMLYLDKLGSLHALYLMGGLIYKFGGDFIKGLVVKNTVDFIEDHWIGSICPCPQGGGFGVLVM